MSRFKIFLGVFAVLLHVVQFSSGQASSSLVFTESSLPIVVINTNGQTIRDSPEIIANMGIIDNGTGVRNHLSDPANNYNGKIAIQIRGSSSQSFPKKSYGIETRDNSGNVNLDVSILGMPREHDWILSANYTDKTFCRNVLTYQLSREMGHYAVRTKYVDVVVNGTHMGIYVFMEKIKRDSGRVDIKSLHPNEITQPDITGGYILKVDKTTGSGGAGWTSPYSPINHPNNQKIFIQYDYPSTDSIVSSQKAYIHTYVDSFENALAGSNFRDSIVGYPHFIGNGSWMDYFFCNELSKNVDGYRISSYLYKDKNKSLKAGPVWDYDIAWGNANYCSGNDTTGWAYLFPCTGDGYQIPFWWQRLLQDTNYTNEMKCRWSNYRQNVLSESHIFSAIDSIASLLNESKTWNFTKWPILGTYVWPNPSPQPSTYAGEIQNLKNWVHKRLIWLDSNMPGHCNCNVTASVQNATCNTTCDGKAIAFGSSPYSKTFIWNNGNTSDTLTDLCAGSYSVTMNDKIGCSKTFSVSVSQPSALTINASPVNSTCSGNGCNGSVTVNASGGSSPFTYSWSNGVSGTSVNSLCAGVYNVTVTDGHSCTKTTSVTIQNPLAPVLSQATVSAVTCFGGMNGSASVNVSGGTGPYTYSWSPSGSNSTSAAGLSAGVQIVNVTDATGCSSQISINIPQPAQHVYHSTITNATCHGSTGSASVNVTGGTTPYTYSWSSGGATIPVLNSAQPGVYTLMVTDHAGCTSSSSVTISQPDPFTFVSTIASPTCYGGNDGSADIGATGGTGNLSYLWSPSGATGSSRSNLSAGNYIVTVTDASNCTGTTSLLVTDPQAISLATTATQATCGLNDGTATVIVTHATQPYQYDWSPSTSTSSTAQNLNPGNHIVVVTDANGCNATDTVSVASASGLAVAVSGHTTVSCPGLSDASVTLNVTHGSPPYSYQWSPSGGNSSTASNLSSGLYSVDITESNGCHTAYQLSIGEPLPVSVSVNATPVSCYGASTGSLTADVTGGSSPYSYSWSPGIGGTAVVNNLAAGSYSVLVTDAFGCTTSSTMTVPEPSVISISVNVLSATCDQPNGIADAAATGGAGDYNYLWSTGDTSSVVQNLFADNYSVVATDISGCSQTQNFFIPGTPKPNLTLSTLHSVTCDGGHNGFAIVNATGGTGLYTYAWTPNVATATTAHNLFSGIYSVKVTDDGQCSDSIGFIVTEPAPLAALIFSTDVTCTGAADGLLFADAGGGTPPYSFTWTGGQHNDTAFNLSPGIYNLTIADSNNCSTSASGVVSEPDSLDISFFVNDATCKNCTDGIIKATVSGGVQPYNYQWMPISFSADSIFGLGEGNYTLCVTDGNNCQKCDSVKVNGGVIGVEEITKNSSLYVYPNPFSSTTVFAFTLNKKQMVDLKIFSSAGQLIKTLVNEELTAGEQLIQFNGSDLSPGVYFYHFTIASRFQAGAIVISR